MTNSDRLPVVGVPGDARTLDTHPFHGVGEKYINAVAHGAGALPLIIPALGAGPDLEPLTGHVDLDDLVERLDGLFLTGNASNVEPHLYGGPESAPGTLHDPQRDATTLPLIRAAIAGCLPLFAVCRGFEELNVALGGTLHQRVQELPGMLDHRSDKSLPREGKYQLAHAVRLTPGGVLAGLAGAGEVEVNSLHAEGVDLLADGLAVEATAPDGLIEAVRVEDAGAYAVGVQWHPEWRFRENPMSRALFEAFGDAVRARAEARTHRALQGKVA